MKPAMTAQQAAFTDSGKSGLSLYRDIAVGPASLSHFLYYEFSQFFFSGLAGLPGFALRTLMYPPLFAGCGKRPAFGRAVLLRNPKRITLGKKVLIDDFVTLDVRGDGSGITLGNFVCVGRNSIIAAKGGMITIADGTNIGSSCRIASQSGISIGESSLIAAYCYIGPGNHQQDGDQPLISSSMDLRGGVTIGSHVWVGARATILDGVTIGDRAIVGAHSLVRENVPAGAIVAGTPAKIIGEVSGG